MGLIQYMSTFYVLCNKDDRDIERSGRLDNDRERERAVKKEERFHFYSPL